MPWNEHYEINGKPFCFTTLEGPPGILLSVDVLKTLSAEELVELQEWARKYSDERYAIGLAHEAHWHTSYLTESDLRMVIGSETATDDERDTAREALTFLLRGEHYPPPAKQKPRRRKTPGHVYLIVAENGLHKIGRAKRIDERVTHLGIKVPMQIDLVHSIESTDYVWAETFLHDRFHDKREHGEWFDLDVQDVQYICSLDRLDPTGAV